MKTTILAAIALLGASSAMATSTNLVANGSFEDLTGFALANGSWGQSNALAGWTSVSGDSFEIQVARDHQSSYASFNSSYDGAHYLELNANRLGDVSQTLATVAGQTYRLSFAYSGRVGSSGDSLAEVNWGGHQIASLAATANSGWTPYTYTLTATGSQTTLEFVSRGPSASASYGSYLDGVSVSAVPEPATYAMLLTGLGLMATLARRRARAS